MKRILAPAESQIFAVMRIIVGFLFMMHGTQKLFGWPPAEHGTAELMSLQGLAGVIELVAGILIAIGFLTGIAAFIASGEMAAAFFIAHAPSGWNPLLNGGEKAVVYCFLFLFIAAHGAGIWSVDQAMSRRSKP